MQLANCVGLCQVQSQNSHVQWLLRIGWVLAPQRQKLVTGNTQSLVVVPQVFVNQVGGKEVNARRN